MNRGCWCWCVNQLRLKILGETRLYTLYSFSYIYFFITPFVKASRPAGFFVSCSIWNCYFIIFLYSGSHRLDLRISLECFSWRFQNVRKTRYINETGHAKRRFLAPALAEGRSLESVALLPWARASLSNDVSRFSYVCHRLSNDTSCFSYVRHRLLNDISCFSYVYTSKIKSP